MPPAETEQSRALRARLDAAYLPVFAHSPVAFWVCPSDEGDGLARCAHRDSGLICRRRDSAGLTRIIRPQLTQRVAGRKWSLKLKPKHCEIRQIRRLMAALFRAAVKSRDCLHAATKRRRREPVLPPGATEKEDDIKGLRQAGFWARSRREAHPPRCRNLRDVADVAPVSLRASEG